MKVLADVTEDSSAVSSMHQVAHNNLELQLHKVHSTILASVGTRHACGAHIHTEDTCVCVCVCVCVIMQG